MALFSPTVAPPLSMVAFSKSMIHRTIRSSQDVLDVLDENSVNMERRSALPNEINGEERVRVSRQFIVPHLYCYVQAVINSI
jgi:hypothetical protein